jgi:LPPG:FO 2-phospho-L-lactate transferase
MHVLRTDWLRRGETLTAFARHAAVRMGLAADILPMSDDPVRTMVETDEGPLAFQRYFVERRCTPAVRAISFAGAGEARPSPALLPALARSDLKAIVICPSNPCLSIDPLLAVPGLRAALAAASAPVVAVSPLIGGQAVKGPTAKIMAELGIGATTQAIAAHYRGLLDGLVIDTSDAGEARGLGVRSLVTATLMHTLEDRERLAREVLRFAAELAAEGAASPEGTRVATGAVQ